MIGNFFYLDESYLKALIWRELNPKSVLTFAFGFLVCLILTFLLSKVYIRYGHSASNRRSFAANFMLIGISFGIITMAIVHVSNE